MSQQKKSKEELVQKYAESAVSIIPGDENRDIVLLCEHGGQKVPAAWQNLGLTNVFFETHFGCDLGSKDLTLAIANRLGATAIVSQYSRLFLDYNRKKTDPSCIRTDMAGIPVPGNLNITLEEKELRERIARKPVEDAVAAWTEGSISKAKAIISIHSFSPIWENELRRCEIGVMWREDPRLPSKLIEEIKRLKKFKVEENQPYSFKENDWFTLDRHGLSTGVPNAYIEIRNDLIENSDSKPRLLDILTESIWSACASL